MIDPRDSVLASSLDVLIEDSIEASQRINPEVHETILPCKKEYKHAETWYMGEVESYYNDNYEDDLEYDRTGCHRPEEIFGYHQWCDPQMVLKFTNGNIDVIIALAESLVANDELIGAGIIITDNKGKFYNPLHPLMAQEILLEQKLPFEEFTILFYPSTESSFQNVNVSYKQFIDNICKHINKNRDKNDYSVFNVEEYKQKILDDTKDMRYHNKINHSLMDDNQPEFIITPIGMMDVEGVIYPYYGVIESFKDTNGFRSRNLAPMCTGNVSQSTNINEAQDESGIHCIESQIDFDQTCIGQFSPTEHTNLKHMNIMNVQSMYNNEVIALDYKSFIYNNIKASIEILRPLQENTNGKEGTNEQETNEEETEPQSTGHVQHEQNVSTPVGSSNTQYDIRSVSA